ncbi:MAG: EamA family transporter, partial [Acidimicrobiia bacterium]
MSRLGYLSVAVAGILWAVGGTFARTLIDRGASPVELTEARAWIALVFVGLLVYARKGSRARHERPKLALIIAFGLSLAMANFTYYLAISLLPVAVAIVVQYSAPAFVVIYKAMVDRLGPSLIVVAALLMT